MQAAITGEWRRPVNTAAHQKGGIHDDDTATDLGFRGGTVAGAIHMEQFPPLLLEMFGADFWQTGTLSMYFRSATVDREPVRCLTTEPKRVGNIRRTNVWMEKEDGTIVASGTASCGGHDEKSELRRKLESIRPISELRILKNLKVGAQCEDQRCFVENSFLDAQLGVITEPLSCYKTSNEFSGRVLPVTQVVRAFDAPEVALITEVEPPFVGLYGAIEIEFINGPVLAETEYKGSGEIVGLSDSPQTEILWRDSILMTDKPIARMLKMDRLMKNSSPLWD
ncbi:hypothetical protein N8881_02105 [Pseudomonadales bacterium]|jgi:hypothetical protein|nr:hypothetical protein [Gammaproteobacteria bacterium]MDA7725559.1 hypothetical protein [Pseudomonadales bacterium]MDC1017413.1 hypothetical protein [Pseudomonadales bacterium]MDC1478187.1 hypothetical protein [Pseudomonadales bacterium]|tara:strand:+ start:9576 stop:10418 length:843 start_codon:yes stop_codon:yes gene_type:complete